MVMNKNCDDRFRLLELTTVALDGNLFGNFLSINVTFAARDIGQVEYEIQTLG